MQTIVLVNFLHVLGSIEGRFVPDAFSFVQFCLPIPECTSPLYV